MLLCVDLLPVKCMKSKFLCDIFPLFNHPLIYQGNALSITISQYSLVKFCYCMQNDVTAQGDVMVLWTHENPKIYSDLAGMDTIRDHFVIPLTRTFCGNFFTTKANLSPAKQSKTASLNTVKYNATQHKP